MIDYNSSLYFFSLWFCMKNFGVWSWAYAFMILLAESWVSAVTFISRVDGALIVIYCLLCRSCCSGRLDSGNRGLWLFMWESLSNFSWFLEFSICKGSNFCVFYSNFTLLLRFVACYTIWDTDLTGMLNTDFDLLSRFLKVDSAYFLSKSLYFLSSGNFW